MTRWPTPALTGLIRPSAIVTFGLLAATMHPLSADPLFPNPINPVGSSPFFVATVDVNNDDKIDIATANFGFSEPGDISILLGNGDGTFEPEKRFPVGEGPSWIAFGDLNGDVNLDLAVANYWSGDVSVLLGIGDGSFGPQSRFSTGSLAFAVAIADFDKDGRQDLLVSNNGSGYVTWCPGNGDGTFGFQHQIFGVGAPAALVVGDFDENGTADFAVTDDQGDRVAVLLGEGDGRFLSGRTFVTGDFPESITRADFNGDGHSDLAVANRDSDDVTLLLGDGAGGFNAGPLSSVGRFPLSIVAADFTGDGKPDLVTTNAVEYYALTGDLSLLEGRGDGTFRAERRLSVGPNPSFAACSDFDADSSVDLVVVGPTLPMGATVILHPDHPSPGPAPATKLAGGIPEYVVVKDFDGDGHKDLISGTPGRFVFQGTLRFHKGLGDGAFLPDTEVYSDGFLGVASGDFNQDGHADLVVKFGFPGLTFRVGFGDGHGGFSFVPAGITTVQGSGNLAVGDFDGDGDDDVALHLLHYSLRPSGESRGFVYLNDGEGLSWTEREIPVGTNPFDLLSRDLNHDGLADLVIANLGTSDCSSNPCRILEAGVLVLISRGDGTFVPTAIPTRLSVISAAIGDLDSDGHLDLAGATLDFYTDAADYVSLMFGSGDGSFSAESQASCPGCRLKGIAVDDFDADGILDVAVRSGHGVPDVIKVLRGNGNGTFKEPISFLNELPQVNYGTPVNYLQNTRIFSEDLDSDGRIDLIMPLGDGLGIYLNGGPFPNHAPVPVATATSPAECTSPAGATVTLDGSSSTDADSTPGTLDDIASFGWFEDYGMPTQRPLGMGMQLTVPLPLGGHEITLRVADKRGAEGMSEVFVNVVDTTPPAFSINVNPTLLWPPNHRMVEVTASLNADDACGASRVVLTGIGNSEPDDAPGGGDGATLNDIQGVSVGLEDRAVLLRAERASLGPGRSYLVTYVATDDAGHSTTRTASILVPHDRGGVTEPVSLTVEESVSGTLVRWAPVAGALFYNTVRGDVHGLRDTLEQISLGALVCLEHRSTDPSTAGDEDRQAPPPGEAFFYLVEYNDGLDSSFGSEDVKKPRVGGPGGCGSSSRLVATGE